MPAVSFSMIASSPVYMCRRCRAVSVRYATQLPSGATPKSTTKASSGVTIRTPAAPSPYCCTTPSFVSTYNSAGRLSASCAHTGATIIPSRQSTIQRIAQQPLADISSLHVWRGGEEVSPTSQLAITVLIGTRHVVSTWPFSSRRFRTAQLQTSQFFGRGMMHHAPTTHHPYDRAV